MELKISYLFRQPLPSQELWKSTNFTLKIERRKLKCCRIWWLETVKLILNIGYGEVYFINPCCVSSWVNNIICIRMIFILRHVFVLNLVRRLLHVDVTGTFYFIISPDKKMIFERRWIQPIHLSISQSYRCVNGSLIRNSCSKGVKNINK